jgi:transcriptional regulator with XRE-family HTH domain
MQHVGKKIRQYRLMKGLSQQQLAELIHKGRPLISHIENTGKVNHTTMLSICKVLQITPEQLTTLSEEPFVVWGAADQNEVQIMKAEITRLKAELKLKDELILAIRAHLKEVKGKAK